MEVTLTIPDDIASHLSAAGDLPRRALEAVAAEGYRRGRVTKAELRRMLGISDRFLLDEFLHLHGIHEGYTLQEIQTQVQTLERLGF